ncbi:MAG: Mth938-like domain-containing protein [Gammaproteobacteria bacterium]|jgi:uncharacterized protein
MKFSEDKTGGLLITSYRPGEIRVASESWRSSILIHTAACSSWEIDNIGELCADHLHDIIAFAPDILLIGTGPEQLFPDIESYAGLLELNIGVEIMDSAAAARTYNVLVSEGRNVMAGIIV